MKAQQFKSAGEIKESFHTFLAESTKRKLAEAARKEHKNMGDVVDMLVEKKIRTDGVILW